VATMVALEYVRESLTRLSCVDGDRRRVTKEPGGYLHPSFPENIGIRAHQQAQVLFLLFSLPHPLAAPLSDSLSSQVSLTAMD
jgi:hypothetical protein